MRTGPEALVASKRNSTIPYYFISGVDGQTREVDSLECMRDVLANFDLIPTDESVGADYTTANVGWALSQSRNINDRSPREGQPLYFPNPRVGSSGHVVLATGVGEDCYSTPIWGPGLPRTKPYYGKFIASIDEIARLCGNAYAGSANDFNGTKISYEKPKPTTGDENMAKIFTIYDDSGKTVKKGQSFLFPSTIDFPVGPLSGTPTTAGDYYELVTLLGVPVDNTIGGATYEFYAGLQTKRAQKYRDDHPGSGGGGGSAPTAAQNADAVAVKLAPAFAAIPTAQENANATATELGDRLDGVNDGK